MPQLNPNRAMLGAMQLAWAKQTLLGAQNAGTPWKFVVISTPIDQTGPAQDGKSWFGGYAAERNDLLKFIADHKIRNVVFLTTDDHLVRMTALNYFTDLNDPSTARLVPGAGAFQIVAGPIGAGGPDAITDHSFANIQSLFNTTNSGLQAFDAPTIGLCGFTGLSNVHRQGDSDPACSGVEFFSPDTFNYSILDVSADGSSLTVDVWGIPSYQQNTFPQDGPVISDILGFTIQAGFLATVSAPTSIMLLAVGLAGLALLGRVRA